MKTLCFMLGLFFFNNPIPVFSASGNPAQEETVIPVIYAPQNPVQEKTAIQPKSKIDFGNYTTSILIQKAWVSLASKDLKAVEAYVGKINELYAKKAKAMQMGLRDYASGSNDQIFKYWALNDVGTAWFILGEAYRNAGQKQEAARAYRTVINEYSFAQCWDPHGWFWKPAFAAKENLDWAHSGIDPGFGDHSSYTLVQKAWGALEANDLKSVKAYVDKTIELYGPQAKEMQSSLKGYTWPLLGSKEKTFSYWALNDVGTALFILGEAYQNAGKNEKAARAYRTVINEYSFAQCWDPHGWFWNPSEASQQRLFELGMS